MMSQKANLRVLRGLGGLLFYGIAGASAAAIIIVLATALGWLLDSQRNPTWDYDLQVLKERLVGPVIGCAIFCGCAGWATWAPAGQFRFFTTFILIAVIGMPCSVIVAGEPSPKNGAMMLIDPPMFMRAICPPILVTVLLTLWRVGRARKA